MHESSPHSSSVVNPRLMVVMFTDLVNSSFLKHELGHDRYRQSKTLHDSFIYQALSIAPTRRALQDTGDGFFLSFESVRQAISAAFLFQWLMANEAWPHPFQSRVGIHLGEVEEGISQVTGQADFTSSAIDLASRTMSLAAGGQILMTRSVYDAARQSVRAHPAIPSGAEPPAIKWAAHGYYHFKGFDEPSEIFEVGAEGIAPLQPPPNSEKASRFRPVSWEHSSEYPHSNKATTGSKPSLLTRRRIIIAIAIAMPAMAISGGMVVWLRRRDPLVEMRRKQIARDIESLLSEPPKTATAKREDVKLVDHINVSDNAAFDVISDERVIDLRGWKEVPPEKLGDLYSQITMSRRLQLKKRSPVKVFDIQGRTSGLDVVLACEEPFPQTYEAQRSEVFVGEERMKLRKIAIDVSSVEIGREFNLHVLSTFWNSMQTDKELWFGLIGYEKSFVASMLILFPADKPFEDYFLKFSRTEKDALDDYDGPRIVLLGDAHDWIYWEIPSPEPGHVYRLHWTW